jgi:glycosyltransferase involved in cell wall biosynthesis
MRVLSLSCVYPNPSDPGLGLFVRSRLEQVAKLADVKVIAPVAVLDYSRTKDRWIGSRGIPKSAPDQRPEVIYPRWLYPPYGGAANSVLLFLQLLGGIRKLRRTFPFEVIDAHFAHPDGTAAALLAACIGCPFTITLRGNETMHAQYPFRMRLMRWALKRAARVIAVSERLRQFAISMGVDPQRAVTIPNGINSSLFYPRDRTESRIRHGIPANRTVVLSTGALIERKGHHRTVQALGNLRGKGIDAELLIAGSAGREGIYEEQIRRTTRETGMEDRVRFVGQVTPETLAELMSAADVFCLASTREGWPNVVHEAMACGAPIVATDVGGVPDMVPSREYGFVVQAGNAAALEEALERAIGNKWDRAKISQWAHSRSWEQVGRETFEQLQLAAGRNRGL